MVVGSEDIDSGVNNLWFWQSIWNSRQIIADVIEKLGNYKEIFLEEESAVSIYLIK